MYKTYFTLFLGMLMISCNQNPKGSETISKKRIFNPELAAELKTMAEIDQIAAYIPQGKYKELSKEEWRAFKDSVYTSNEKRLQELFKEYGFLGFDIVGTEGSSNFWLMTQHADHNPTFQKQVLEKMKIEVGNNNAHSTDYGLLVDRVQLNTGQPQTYGTQVQYNKHTGQAYPRKLKDSIHVNERRKKIGLEPLEKYLNDMSTSHFIMNREYFKQLGINEAKLYTIN